MERHPSLQQRLAASEALVGLLQTQPNLALTELAGMCRYDFLLLDGEHGVFSEQDYLHATQVLMATDTFAMVRLPQLEPSLIGRYLDIGVHAIVAPGVSTTEQAQALARAMEYPPSGTRGFGAGVHRVTRYGLDLLEYMKAPRNGRALIVMIESALGVANVDDIVAVDGVDGIFIGPADLSASLGCQGDFSSSLYVDAMERIERAAAAHGKFVGTVPLKLYPLETLLARGHRVILLGADMTLIRDAMTSQLDRARSIVQLRR